MTHLTRCPACATVFRVTEPQLDSRQGFVRCGQCAKVFDARATLMVEASVATADAPEATAAGEQAWSEEYETTAPSETTPAPTPALPPEADALPSEAPDTGPASQPPVGSEPEYSLAEPEPVAPVYEFGPKHRARSRTVTVLWGLGSVIGVLALLAQGAYWFRTELATGWPGTRPHLQAVCRQLGCNIPPPRETALLSIESSELQVDRNVPGLLTLNATLRNRATFAQAHPSIELTLTDAAERPLSRRVLGPADYLGDRLTRDPLFPAASEHSVRLHIDATAYRPTGYRMFLFHP